MAGDFASGPGVLAGNFASGTGLAMVGCFAAGEGVAAGGFARGDGAGIGGFVCLVGFVVVEGWESGACAADALGSFTRPPPAGGGRVLRTVVSCHLRPARGTPGRTNPARYDGFRWLR
ncbi:hypothetical protein JCM33774_11690 [Actinophytocola sp. KF-1]